MEEGDPENGVDWEHGGRKIALQTLAITTANLVLGFAVWFVVSALVVLDEDEMTYVGLVCLRGDRHRLCVDTARLDCRPLVSNR